MRWVDRLCKTVKVNLLLLHFLLLMGVIRIGVYIIIFVTAIAFSKFATSYSTTLTIRSSHCK